MNYSSVVITLSPGIAAGTLESVSQLTSYLASSLTGVEVHYVDKASRRAVCVIEVPNTAREMDAFEALSRTPGVLDVSLVNHWFEEEV